MTITFHKMHGIGNDYIYIDGMSGTIDRDSVLRKIVPYCDRRKGVGSDGVIFIMPSEVADAKMEMFNVDASRAEMCGNGSRCCIQLLHRLGYVKSNKISLETDVGLIEAEVSGKDVTLKMYQAPKVSEKEESILSDDREFKFHRGDIGNPHAVIMCEEVETFNVMRYGKPIENNLTYFPKRVNVEFFKEIKKGHLFMRVWERGSGETHACGTGAAVTAGVYRFMNGNTMNEVRVDLLGGSLYFRWDGNDFYMRGEAEYVFEGKIKI